ncbi:MerR family transcriptional regulator [Enterococcus sp. BWR-S5]|uniref:MerR family transcriptional regulator n=1 Tax=Enterococcus sp. BWR-S5 TaxID=2787714 RepID=UPI0019209691|nr:MerR family transcriptional regulator [Enterococcus sp. BWR-S5]MBL1226619.1 MerR family transcriptional regulator [Enterococcus sp. BWR-S5]
MTYTIKEVSELFDLSIYTLRYYDKQGLLPFVSKNKSGYREFTDSDLGFIHTICCLKNTGMAIKDIRTYISYCMEGTSTISAREQLLSQHRKNVLQEISNLENNLKEIDHKLDVYTAPNAVEIISAQRQFSSQEKEQHALVNPFID